MWHGLLYTRAGTPGALCRRLPATCISINLFSMASFYACPRELTDSMLEQVSTCDLAAMSLTSKNLHAAATPLLYSQIVFSMHRDKSSSNTPLSKYFQEA